MYGCFEEKLKGEIEEAFAWKSLKCFGKTVTRCEQWCGGTGN